MNMPIDIASARTDLKKKLLLILNGKTAGDSELRQAIQAIREQGYCADIRVTWEAGDAEKFADEVAGNSDVTVVAVGGDGTVNEVVNGLLKRGKPKATMGIVPMGTANDFSTSMGIVKGNPRAALELVLQSSPVWVDAGWINGKVFINVASGGFGAEVTADTSPELKRAIGGGAYALTALVMTLKARPYHGRLITPDKTYEGAMIMMAVGNGRQAGGGTHITPHAVINDGLLDVMVVPDHESHRIPHLLAALTELKLGSTEHFHYLRCAHLTIESDDELQFNLDGEPVRGKHFEFKVLPACLALCLPHDSSLLGG